MVQDRQRIKLINAILFFTHRTTCLGKTKLFKLLYLTDFEHFQQTGRTVTGLEYRAWENGPVPRLLWDQWEQRPLDLDQAISIRPVQVYDYPRQEVEPKAEFDDSEFTKRELRIMESFANQYKDVRSPDLIDVTHAENGAWARVWRDGEGNNDVIPTELAISDEGDRERLLENAEEHRAIASAVTKAD